ncbi:hypothetical protein B0F90DRAFT_1751200 [Multifurca ochricompacta]|uniref:Uncharacterized protein n=1 Tax=Multifurca ochricompacta TaxID=376703 RepID=A0AAD4QKY3_9AGAM|nr:hypothetical protein B0F90DRAFT_1751200 [Multifurca ochricompacta]
MTTHLRWPPFPSPSLHFIFLLLTRQPRVHAQIVTTIEDTDPRISYLPSVCNNTGVVPSSSCTAPWQVVVLPGASSGTVTSTHGPTSSGGGLIPQLFLVFRGAFFILSTSPASNATANVTVLASPSNVFVSTAFDSSAGSISTVNLPPDQDVTLAVTFIPSPDGEPTRLDIDSVTVFSQDESHTSLTSTPLPSSSSLPSFIIPAPPTSTSTPRPHSSLAQPKGTIIGESLAGFFGLILILISIYTLRRWGLRRILRSREEEVEMQTRDKGKGKAMES